MVMTLRRLFTMPYAEVPIREGMEQIHFLQKACDEDHVLLVSVSLCSTKNTCFFKGC